MKHYGISVTPERRSTLPTWDSEYESRFIYSEATDFLSYGSDVGWVTISGGTGTVTMNPIPSADQSASGDIVTMQVDVNATGFGATLHMDTDGNWVEADADSDSTMPCQALALETGTGSKEVLLRGFIRDDAWAWTVGGVDGLIYTSCTVGGLTQTTVSGSGDQAQVVGFATHTNRMFFNPNYLLIEIS